ncbi:hypothetical protein QWZ10_11120 [Paracoccus cavernae]|uniref:Uncharacterized protein n=1 Tax=Paracoccus cavernae TaxID=1571207 RepID=A0ABT8D9U8_9RHOB|nr:hypothetical protein [Paracoccus cavernae]
MELIDKDTRDAVVDEFCNQIEAIGLHFPGNIDGALNLLQGHLSDNTTSRLRRLAALSGRAILGKGSHRCRSRFSPNSRGPKPSRSRPSCSRTCPYRAPPKPSARSTPSSRARSPMPCP